MAEKARGLSLRRQSKQLSRTSTPSQSWHDTSYDTSQDPIQDLEEDQISGYTNFDKEYKLYLIHNYWGEEKGSTSSEEYQRQSLPFNNIFQSVSLSHSKRRMSKERENPRQGPSDSHEGIARSQPNLPQKIKRLDSSTSSRIGKNNNENGSFLRRTQSQ